MQQGWSATVTEIWLVSKKDRMYIMLQSQTARAILSKGIKIPKFNMWSMEFVDDNITTVHIKGKTKFRKMLSLD